MKINDLGPGLQFRYVLVDANEKVIAAFADLNKAKAYLIKSRGNYEHRTTD